MPLPFFGRTNCDLQIPYKLDPNPWKQHQNWLAIERWATYLTRNCLTGPADAYGQLAMCTPWELVAEADAYAQFDLARFGSGVTLNVTGSPDVAGDQNIEVDTAGVWQVSADVDYFWSSVEANGTSAVVNTEADEAVMTNPQQVELVGTTPVSLDFYSLRKCTENANVSVTPINLTSYDFYGTLYSGALASFQGYVRLEAQFMIGKKFPCSEPNLAAAPTAADVVEAYFVKNGTLVKGSRVQAAGNADGFISVHLSTFEDCLPGDEFEVVVVRVAGSAELWIEPDFCSAICEESDDPCIGWDADPPCEQAGVGQPCAVRMENYGSDAYFSVTRQTRPSCVINVETDSLISGTSTEMEIRPDMLSGTASVSGLVVLDAGDKVRLRLVNGEPSLSFFYTSTLNIHRVSTDVPSVAGCGGGGEE